jgi:hypothetical protein
MAKYAANGDTRCHASFIVVVLAAPGSHPQPVTSTHLCDMFSPALNAFFGYNLPVLRRRDDGINQPKLARLLVLSLYRP